jgi:hypothetical protein
MSLDLSIPLWLWRAVTWGVGLLVIAITALALALANGLADPPRAGPLLWEDDFKGPTSRWEWVTAGGAALAPHNGALVADFTGPDQTVFALAPNVPGDFTLEIAGAQPQGAIGAKYGLVFAWHDAQHYSAVLVNGNGYAGAHQQRGEVHVDWFPWAQWPHILVGTEANRVRVDVWGDRVTARINDELLAETTVAGGNTGRLGVMALSTGPGRVVFSWVKVWGK